MPDTDAPTSSPSASIGDLITAIEYDWMLGWIACQIAKRYQLHRDAEDFLQPSWLHQMSYIACEREALMTAARLTDRGPDSISIHKLLNVAESAPRHFNDGATDPQGRPRPNANPAVTLAFVRQSREALSLESDALRRIRSTRDKVLAHTDRVRLSDPSQLAGYHVNVAELESVYLHIRTITEECRRLYDNSTFHIDNIAEDLDREFGFLREAYEALGAKIMAELEERRRAGPWARPASTDEKPRDV
ncbi:MAG: hypothetical protein U0531_22585 [Dehalococcoidia bacterium]